MAITEAHLACTREEQLRWVRDLYNDVVKLKSGGVDIRALTVWSLLGAFDWNSALTRQDGYYECGAFDVSAGAVRETALASYVRTLAKGERTSHPAIEGRGWWRLPGRTLFPPAMRTTEMRPIPSFDDTRGTRRPIVIIGADDPVGQTLRRACRERNLEFRVISAAGDGNEVAAYLTRSRAWLAIDCTGADAAWDGDAEMDGASLFRHFATVVHACRAAGVPLAAISSPLVFSGKCDAYRESDPVKPTTARGALYAEIEELLRVVAPRALIVRGGIPFGGDCAGAWHERVLERMLRGERADVSPNHCSVVHRDDFVRILLDLAIDGERGIVHVVNGGRSSVVEVLEAALRRTKGSARIDRVAKANKRKRYVLSSERIVTLPAKDVALAHWIASRMPQAPTTI